MLRTSGVLVEHLAVGADEADGGVRGGDLLAARAAVVPGGAAVTVALAHAGVGDGLVDEDEDARFGSECVHSSADESGEGDGVALFRGFAGLDNGHRVCGHRGEEPFGGGAGGGGLLGAGRSGGGIVRGLVAGGEGEGFGDGKAEAPDGGRERADEADGEAAGDAGEEDGWVEGEGEGAHGETDGEAVEEGEADGEPEDGADGGGEEGFLGEAHDDGAACVAERLEHADLADAGGERGVHGVEPAQDASRRDEQRGDDDHDADGSVELGDGAVVGRFADGGDLEVEAAFGEEVGLGKGTVFAERNDDAADRGLALGGDLEVRDGEPDLGVHDGVGRVELPDDGPGAVVEPEGVPDGKAFVGHAQSCGGERADHDFFLAAPREAALDDLEFRVDEQGDVADAPEDGVEVLRRARVLAEGEGHVDLGGDVELAGGFLDARDARGGDGLDGGIDLRALDALLGAGAEDDDVLVERRGLRERELHASDEAGGGEDEDDDEGGAEERGGEAHARASEVAEGDLAAGGLDRGDEPGGDGQGGADEHAGGEEARVGDDGDGLALDGEGEGGVLGDGERAEGPERAAGERDDDALAHDEPRDDRPAEAEGLEDGVLGDARLDREDDRVADEREDGEEAAEPEPAGEADELDDVVRDAADEGFFGERRGGLLRGAEHLVDVARDAVERARVLHAHVELGDEAQLVSPGELDELERGVRDVVVLRVVRADDAGDVRGDARGVERHAGLEASAGGEGLSEQRGVGAPVPVFDGAGDDLDLVALLVEEGVFGDAAEGDDVEGRAAVGDDDFDGHGGDDALDARDAGDVVLREDARRGAVAVLAVDDEGGLVGLFLRGECDASLHGLDGGEEEHGDGDAGGGEDGAHAVAPDLLEVECSFGVVGGGGVVGNHDDGGAGFFVELDEEGHDGVGGNFVEVSGRLVGDEDGGVGDDGAGDGDALLLAAGELAGEVVGAVRDTHPLQRTGDAIVALPARERVDEQGELDVLVGSEDGDEVVELEDVADVFGAPVRELGAGEPGDVLALDDERARGGRVDAGDEVEEGGLAGAGGAHEGEEVAALDAQVEAVEGADGVLALGVLADELGERDALAFGDIGIARDEEVARAEIGADAGVAGELFDDADAHGRRDALAVAPVADDEDGGGVAGSVAEGVGHDEDGRRFGRAAARCSPARDGRVRQELHAGEHLGLEDERRVDDADLDLQGVLLEIGLVGDAGDLALERGVGEDVDDDLALLADGDVRRVGEGDVDADLEVFGVVDVDEVRGVLGVVVEHDLVARALEALLDEAGDRRVDVHAAQAELGFGDARLVVGDGRAGRVEGAFLLDAEFVLALGGLELGALSGDLRLEDGAALGDGVEEGPLAVDVLLPDDDLEGVRSIRPLGVLEAGEVFLHALEHGALGGDEGGELGELGLGLRELGALELDGADALDGVVPVGLGGFQLGSRGGEFGCRAVEGELGVVLDKGRDELAGLDALAFEHVDGFEDALGQRCAGGGVGVGLDPAGGLDGDGGARGVRRFRLGGGVLGRRGDDGDDAHGGRGAEGVARGRDDHPAQDQGERGDRDERPAGLARRAHRRSGGVDQLERCAVVVEAVGGRAVVIGGVRGARRRVGRRAVDGRLGDHAAGAGAVAVGAGGAVVFGRVGLPVGIVVVRRDGAAGGRRGLTGFGGLRFFDAAARARGEGGAGEHQREREERGDEAGCAGESTHGLVLVSIGWRCVASDLPEKDTFGEGSGSMNTGNSERGSDSAGDAYTVARRVRGGFVGELAWAPWRRDRGASLADRLNLEQNEMKRSGMFVCGALVVSVAGACASAQFDPPAGYYSGATGTGATLKGQLYDAMRTGHVQRNYGSFRNSAMLHDADPDTPGNILLVYNRQSVSGVWNSGVTWNREHVWPQSLQPGSANNSTTGNLGDPHALRPVNPGVNGARGNLAFSLNDGGPFGGGGWDPGLADRGDMARCLFYSDTRYGPELGLSLVRSDSPGANQMGNLDFLIAWHYEDVPDHFELRRNHVIATQSENPAFFTSNRNAYVDRPEFVWSVYQGQDNDTRLSFGAPDPDGGSDVVVDLGAVFVDLAGSSVLSVTLEKDGEDGTYFEISTSGSVVSPDAGRYNAFPMTGAGADSREIALTLDPLAGLSAGVVSGTVTVDNLDVTTMGGAGRGANDADDTATVTLAVLDRANGSFEPSSDVNSVSADFGEIDLGQGDATVQFMIHNLESTAGFTAGLDAELGGSSGDTGRITTAFAGVDALPAGAAAMIEFTLDDGVAGDFLATYVIDVFDDRAIDGFEQGHPLTVTLTGTVGVLVCDGDCDGSGVVDFNDLVSMLFEFGPGTGACDADGGLGAGPRDGVADGFEERRAGDGLGEVAVAAGVEAALALAVHGVRGDGDDGECVASPAQLAGGLVAVELGHLHVHEDDVERRLAAGALFESLDRLEAVAREGDLGAGFLELEADEPLVVRAVLGEEDAQAVEAHAGGRRGAGRARLAWHAAGDGHVDELGVLDRPGVDGEGEGAAATELGFERERAAEEPAEGARDAEPETGAAEFPGGGGVHLRERVELRGGGALAFVHADAGVGDVDAEPRLVVAVLEGDADGDGADLGELDG
ncbi:bsn, partial [Symbiodinium necroappetens]